jgi:hypothetical protein
MIQIFSKKIDPLPLVRGNGPMVQSPYAPPLIPEATNRKTEGTAEVVPVRIDVVGVQESVPSIGPGKRRRPAVTPVANVDEVPVVEPSAARPCRETRRVGRARVGSKPPPGCRLSNRALQSTSCDARTTQKGL